MKLASVLLTIFLVTRSAFADETNLMLTVDGVTYSNVTFGAATPVSLSVRHSTGVASIPLAKLPQEIQKRFEYDPQKAADYVQKQGVAAKLAAERAEQERQRQTARQWADALAKKEQPRYREISGKLYDFSSAIAFANQEPRGFFVGGDYMRSIGGNLPPGVVQSQQAAAAYQAEMAKWGKYLIRGKVIQVLQDGLLVDGDSKNRSC